MKVLLDEKGYISSFTINEDNLFKGLEDKAVILPNPENKEHFIEYYMHYNKDGFDQEHYDTWLSQKELEKTKAEVQVRINELKAQLSASDYKVIKCMEAQLSGEESPYDIGTIHAERQAIRNQINDLEAL